MKSNAVDEVFTEASSISNSLDDEIDAHNDH
jgi:hypothetical protein